MNQVVVLNGVTYTAPNNKNFTISKGGVDVKGYNQFGIEIAAPEDGKTYNITGVISVYNADVQFQPIAIEDAGTTGINALKAAAQNGAIYNVAGQKVNAGYKGLIIMNGNKFVNK